MSALCSCGEPVATCPHVGLFGSLEEKHAYFRRLDAVHDELDVLAARTDAALAIAVAQRAAEEASRLPVPAEVAAALVTVLSALGKAAALVGL